ncbi:Fumarylacetoacetate hydrolase domain-containing protein 2 [Yarrowia sp. C11]|nr:Fumarylacetoacetate hydrolase domain-containing protein 2 [Yarrowia sp. C11]KAG5363989.1 Fumarylacetoacetate hydrolase domain-containing protein 2 [Yarrowia sp. E02]
MSRQFTRLIRFLGTDSKVYFGDAILPSGSKDARLATEAYLIGGDIFGSYTVTDTKVGISKLLSPLNDAHTRTVRFVGMNYGKHADELGMPRPQYPVLFYKPVTALNGPTEDVIVPRIAQATDATDYECELVVVIGKRCRDVNKKEALDYVLGYSCGNDLSQRTWQTERGGGQFSLGKMYDGWAPFGPAIVSPKLAGNPDNLKLSTKVNGELVQDADTTDMIHKVAEVVSFYSQGSTLMPGDLIFTGTPFGVAAGRNPHNWLKDGDVVEIEVENLGTLKNKIVFEKGEKPKL